MIHPAAERAANARRGSIMSTQAYIDDLQTTITHEYTPLVEAARNILAYGNAEDSARHILALRDALKEVAGE